MTPTEVRGLKLARDGDVYLQEGKKWTHLNAQVTYAKHDRFKERPQKVKGMTTATLEGLRKHGFVRPLDENAALVGETPHGIKMHLLKIK